MENQKENTIKEKKTKRPKKKRKTTEKKQKEPPLISVGLPFNSHDVFDHISNSESPDPLIK